MKLNSNQAFNLLGIICLIAIFGAMIVAAWAGLSTAGIIITGVVVAMIGNFAGMILLARYSSEQNAPINGFNIDEVKVARTALSTGIEILVGFLTALTWVMAVKNGLFTEEDGSFNFRTLFSLLVFTCGIIFMLWDTYNPGDMNNVGKLTNLKQAKLINWLYRVEAVIIALFMMLIPFQRFNATWLICGMAVATMISGIVFLILIHRAKE